MPEDVARMALWLAALDSRMCTGQSFVVDGARSSATRACTMAVDDDSFLIALPYGTRTDWLKNVLGRGSAAIVTSGHTYQVDRPEVIPMAEATGYFRPREQRMHRQFHVSTALRIRRRQEAHR